MRILIYSISICMAVVVGALLVAGCGGETGGSGGSSGSGGSGGGGGSASVGGGDCGMSFCGCWTPETLTFSANVITAEAPAQGIELYCKGEPDPIAVSDAMGMVSFSIETMVSPGCGPERCGNLRFHDPAGALADVEGAYYEYNGKDVVMQ
jgi:hypothetical protein